MKAKDILQFYNDYYSHYGETVYLHLSEILAEAKEQHRKDIDKFNAEIDEFNLSVDEFNSKADENTDKKEKKQKKDFEQSWRSVKGASLENLILQLLLDVFKNGVIKIIKGSGAVKLSSSLKTIYDALLVDYHDLGKHLPDSDLIIYTETPPHLVAILSIKASLRERIAQVAYWTSKVEVPYFFITIDEDGDFQHETVNKPRAIAEADTDGVYLLTEKPFITKRADKVKLFHQLVDDIRQLANKGSTS